MFSTYYMNLSPHDAQQVSHASDMIKYCILIYTHDIVVAEKCELSAEHFKVHLFSNDQYFNCYTVEGAPEHTGNVMGLILLVKLTASHWIPELAQSFLIDVLQRGEGLKVSVHEPGRYPNMEDSSINMHPDKLNALVYSPTNWIRLDTPPKPCRKDQADFRDMSRNFRYTFPQCLNSELQSQYIKSCGCMRSNIPRPQEPNYNLPYCMQLVPLDNLVKLNERLQCVGNVTNKSAEKNICYLRCSFTTYETTMSTTRWQVSDQKLDELQNLYRSYLQYRTKSSKNNTEKVKQILKDSLRKSQALRERLYQNKDPNQKFSQTSKSSTESSDEHAYTYISLTRKHVNVDIKTEKLVLEFNTLLSRIGGLSSICIGLTAAAFAELIEFGYLLYHHRSSYHSDPDPKPTGSTGTCVCVCAAQTVGATETASAIDDNSKTGIGLRNKSRHDCLDRSDSEMVRPFKHNRSSNCHSHHQNHHNHCSSPDDDKYWVYS